MSKVLKSVTMLLVLVLMLAACAPATTTAPGETESAAEATEPAATEAETEATEAPAEEGATEEATGEATGEATEAATDEPAEEGAASGEAINMVLLPKFLGILVFNQAHQGAMEAHEEVGNTGTLEFLGPTPENSVAGQIEIVTTATTQGVDAIMISNNSGDQIAPAAHAARDAGMTVVTWDSPIPLTRLVWSWLTWR